MFDVDYLAPSHNIPLHSRNICFWGRGQRCFFLGAKADPPPKKKVSKHPSKTGHSKQCSLPLSPVLMFQLTSNPARSYLCVLLSNPFFLELRLPVPGGIKSAEVTILVVLLDIEPVPHTRISENFWLLLFTSMIPSQDPGQPPVLDLDAWQ